MATKLPSSTLRRAQIPSQSNCQCMHNPQKRNATFLQRPHRPYTFTQLVTLSDGSTYLHRTTSPLPIFRSTRDTRNTPLWQPSMAALRNVEADEAGRLRAFRKKFGRGWDTETPDEDEDSSSSTSSSPPNAVSEARGEEQGDSLMDLISSGYGSREKNETYGKTQGLSTGDSTGAGVSKKTITIKNRETGKLEKVEVKDGKGEKKKDGSKGWGGSS